MNYYAVRKIDLRDELIVLDIVSSLRQGNFSPRKIHRHLSNIGKKRLKNSHLRRISKACYQGKYTNSPCLHPMYDEVRKIIKGWVRLVETMNPVRFAILRGINKEIKKAFPRSSKCKRRDVSSEIFSLMVRYLR